MTRTEFLREQTVSGENKCCRTPLPQVSVADYPCGLTERKALALAFIFDNMPIYIGPRELIVGTRTFFTPKEGNEDGHDRFAYRTVTHIPYLNAQDVEHFGCDQSYKNRTHFTPDFRIILEKGIDGILRDAEVSKKNPAHHEGNREFLSGVILAYNGLKRLILRYAEEADTMAESAEGIARVELLEIARVCRKISAAPPESFHEAIQLLWFAHLGTILESFELINYGRLDVLLGPFLQDTPREEAQQLIECLLMKMHDQTDLTTRYLGKYSAQLVVTLGGVLPDGENAVNEVTMMFLEAISRIRLPDPEFNLRINSKNPPEFLDNAAALTISGCNFISYYNDDLFVESLHRAGIPLAYARDYGFDLCQDVNLPGRGDFWLVAEPSLIDMLMELLKERRNFKTFGELLQAYKEQLALTVKTAVDTFNAAEAHLDLYAKGKIDAFLDGVRHHNKPVDRDGNSPMAPLPFLSALFYGSLESALDVAFEPYPIKEKGMLFETTVEAVNSLAAIKKTVYDQKQYTLDEVYRACEENFQGDTGAVMQSILWNCPKWGNDDDYVDSIAKDLLEFCLGECKKYKTHFGGHILGGIHQPHPVPNGKMLMATPEGRRAGVAVAVSRTPESGTMKNGPTAVLRSASKIDPMLIQWNDCVMVNYFASVFKGNSGKDIFKALLTGYFETGGMQHQPNVLDVEALKQAQQDPGKYKDLIVRLWGVSAHFVDLPKELQDEIIARFQ